MNSVPNVTRASIAAIMTALSATGPTTPARANPQATTPATAPAPTNDAVTNAAGEIVLDFAKVPVGKPTPSWTQGSVTFTLASALQHSKAQPRVMFFPHLKTDRHGILNAMANEQAIPVKAEIAGGAASVTLVLWGTVGCHAWLEAHDKDGKLLDRAALSDSVPQRKSPADPIPSFELNVKAPNIAYILFAGAHNGGALAADEMRYVPTSH